LGAYFTAWVDLKDYLMIHQRLSRTSGSEYQLGQNKTLDYFREFRRLQKRLGIDDRTLIQIVLKMNYDYIKPELLHWDDISAHAKSDD
jgi:hypothetical protein